MDPYNMADLGVKAGSLLYNVFSGEGSRSDYRAQQKYANNFAENSVQIRRKDLEAAGLHPTLATGGAPTPPVGSAAPEHVQAPSVMENAMFELEKRQIDAKIDLTNAEADRIKRLTDIDERKINIEEAQLGIHSNADRREQENYEYAKTQRKLERDLKKAGLSSQKADASLKWIEYRYAKEHNAKMPSANSIFNDIRSYLHNAGLTQDFADSFIDDLKPLVIEGLRKVGETPLFPALYFGRKVGKGIYNYRHNIGRFPDPKYTDK